MKGFVQGITKSVTRAEQAFERAATKTAQQLSSPNAVSQPDVDEAWQEFRDACRDTESIASDSAREEFREHITKCMQEAGMSKAEAEKWFAQKWMDVQKLAEKGRKYGPEAARSAGSSVLRAFVFVAATVGAIGVYFGIDANKQGDQARQSLNRGNLQLDQARMNIELSMSTEEFTSMGGTLNIPNIPPEVFSPPAAPAAAAPPPLPAAAPMPAAVAAIAQAPVQVEVQNGASTYTGTTTVSQFYRAVPQARPAIENHAFHIEHGYDKPTNWNQIVRDAYEHQQQHHVNIDVNAGFASAHFHM
jgi:hypothetical protein